MKNIKAQIQAMVDLETRGWNTKNPDLFLSIIHPDMVWPWPPHQNAHNPVHWVFELGRFNYKRWRKNWQDIFDGYNLIHNRRNTIKIEISQEGDGAYAVVDIDTLWQHKKTGKDLHWKGRVCKIYTKMPTREWKLIAHTGSLHYSGQQPAGGGSNRKEISNETKKKIRSAKNLYTTLGTLQAVAYQMGLSKERIRQLLFMGKFQGKK
ncbi:MAG TPA: hypothetical protein PKV84_00365 [Candidatus Omnitrophota bacterium]|nr:hypothetical protein [Candidatus Omnitrophota bacterium]